MRKHILSVLGVIAIMVFVSAFLPPADVMAEDKAVYVSDKGNDSAAGTAESPKKTLKGAISALGTDGGTVVVCGPLTLTSSSGCKDPAFKGTVTLTSVYGGKDWRTDGAVLKISNDLFLSGQYVFRDITMNCSAGLKIFCKGNTTVFGSGITTKLSGGGSYPYIFGGVDCSMSGVTLANATYKNFSITVDSGTWSCVRGGSFRNDSSQILPYTGDISIIINGGTFNATGSTESDLGVMTLTGFAGLDGDAYMEINGGTINCSIFALGRPGGNSGSVVSNEGNVAVVINGGKFSGKSICCFQQTTAAPLDGDYSLTISGGTQTGSPQKIDASNVNGERRIYVLSESFAKKITGAAKTYYVSSSGSDSSSGLTDKTPLATFGAAVGLFRSDPEGGRIVICDTATIEGSYTGLAGKLEITSAYPGKQYGGKAVFKGDVSFDCDIEINDITVSLSSALTAEGIKIGADVSVEGNASLYSRSSSIEIRSGRFSVISGGKTEGNANVSVYGGDIGTVVGAESSSGDVSVFVFDGSVGGITGVREKCGGDIGVMIYGGTVGSVKACGVSCSGDFGIYLCPSASQLMPDASGVTGKRFIRTSGEIPAGFEDGGTCVYVSGRGTGDGSSPLSPSNDILGAITASKETDRCSVVIIGRFLIDKAKALPEMSSGYSIGSYMSCNFRDVFGSRLDLAAVLTLGGPATIEKTGIFEYSGNGVIACNGYDTTVEDTVECGRHFYRAVFSYPSICGGTVSGGSLGGKKSWTLTVNGGTWQYVFGGRYQIAASQPGSVSADMTVIINGGTYYGGISGGGRNNLTGSASLIVNGGYFRCSLYGTPAPSLTVGTRGTIKGDLSVTINGGTFCGDVSCTQRNEDISMNGKYTLTITGGDFSRVNKIAGADGIISHPKTCTSELRLADSVDLSAAVTGSFDFENPIANYADPSVYCHDGWYYYTYSKDYNSAPALWMSRAANIADIGASEPMLVWSKAASGGSIASLWAPQIYFLDGKWYIYATCAEASDSESRRPYVWVGKGDSPYDGFDFFGTIAGYDKNVYSYLSPRIIEHGGVRYLVCGGFYYKSDRIAGVKHYQELFIGELESPTKFATGMTIISEPNYSWEIDGKVSIMEGPFAIYSPGGQLYIAYAANQTRSDNYCTALLKFTGGENDKLTDRSLWEKQKKPIHEKNVSAGIYSPGAMCFVYSPAGDLWGVYHAKYFPNSGYSNRQLFAQKVNWENEYPVMDPPQPLGTVTTMELNPMEVNRRVGGFDETVVFAFTPAVPGDVNGEGSSASGTTDQTAEITGGETGDTVPGGNDGSRKNTLLAIGITAAVAAVCAVAVVIILKKKKK